MPQKFLSLFRAPQNAAEDAGSRPTLGGAGHLTRRARKLEVVLKEVAEEAALRACPFYFCYFASKRSKNAIKCETGKRNCQVGNGRRHV